MICGTLWDYIFDGIPRPMASSVHLRALFCRAQTPDQPKATTVRLKVKAHSLRVNPPPWENARRLSGWPCLSCLRLLRAEPDARRCSHGAEAPGVCRRRSGNSRMTGTGYMFCVRAVIRLVTALLARFGGDFGLDRIAARPAASESCLSFSKARLRTFGYSLMPYFGNVAELQAVFPLKPGSPVHKSEDSAIDSLLKNYRIVKGALCRKLVFYLLTGTSYSGSRW